MADSLYSPAPFFLVRFATWPYQKLEEIFSKDENSIFDLYQMSPLFQEAISVASPTLASSCDRKKRSSSSSLFKYAVRMATRATPFGLFSSVSLGYWNKTLQVSIDQNGLIKRARPDMEHIYDSIEQGYQKQEKLLQLPVRLNPLAWYQDGRFFLNDLFTKTEKAKEKKALTIKALKLVRFIFKQEGTVKELIEKVKNSYPKADEERLIQMIRELMSNQFLIPANLPSLFSPYEAQKSTDTDFIEKYNQVPFGEGAELLKTHTFPIQVDAAYKGPAIELPKEIGDQLGTAAEIMWKLSLAQGKRKTLEDYHHKFLEKYGVYRIVPLLEMQNQEKGIGPFTQEMLRDRDQRWERWIAKVWEEALFERKKEVVLDDKDFEELFKQFDRDYFDEKHAPNSFDVFAKLQKNNLVELTTIATGGALSFGRFIDMLGKDMNEQIKTFVKEEEKLEPQSVWLDISYWPSMLRCANVAVSPSIHSYRLDLNGKEEDLIQLKDIYVGATLDRFYLTYKDGSVEINAQITNRLNYSFAPSPLEFMLWVTEEKYQTIEPFFWKREATFYPRVRYGKTILSPAKWNLHLDDCRGETADKILEKFDAWRKKWELSEKFIWVRGDQFLVCDANHQIHRKEITDQLRLGRKLELKEFFKHECVKSKEGDHATEVVVPFRKKHPSRQPPISIPKGYAETPLQDRMKFLGSEWFYVKFYMSKDMENHFLLEHLNPFTKILGIDEWFFIRYRDQERHLRVRFHLPKPEFLTPLLKLLENYALEWMKNGAINHYVIDGYEREVEKFGGLQVLPHVEKVFCADSQTAIYLIQAYEANKFTCEREVFEALCLARLMKDLHFKPQRAQKDKSLLKGFRNVKEMLITEGLKNATLFNEASILRSDAASSLLEQPTDSFRQIANNLIHLHANRIGCDHIAESRALQFLDQLIHHGHDEAQFSKLFNTLELSSR